MAFYNSAVVPIIPNRAPQYPDFHTVWAGATVSGSGIPDGIVLGPEINAYPIPAGSGQRRYLTGRDKYTGYDLNASLANIFDAGATLSVYQIPDVTVNNAGELAARFKSDFRTTLDSGMMREDFYFELTQVTNPSPQVNLVIDRPNAGAGLPPQRNIKPLYFKARIYVDPNILSKMSPGDYTEQVWLKSGGYQGNYYGVFRIKIELLMGNNGPYWNAIVDTKGNGTGLIPGFPVDQTYQQNHTDYSTQTAFGGWNTLEYFYNPPANKDDLTTGIFQAFIQPDGGSRIEICNFRGGVLTDQAGLPINRLGFDLYSPVATLLQRIGAWEMWSYYPQS